MRLIHLVFIAYLIVIIAAIHVWRLFANWFVDTEGIVPGIFLLAVLLLILRLPYWDSD
jgi:hypothetical protein